jgi:hypothetical protein
VEVEKTAAERVQAAVRAGFPPIPPVEGELPEGLPAGGEGVVIGFPPIPPVDEELAEGLRAALAGGRAALDRSCVKNARPVANLRWEMRRGVRREEADRLRRLIAVRDEELARARDEIERVSSACDALAEEKRLLCIALSTYRSAQSTRGDPDRVLAARARGAGQPVLRARPWSEG